MTSILIAIVALVTLSQHHGLENESNQSPTAKPNIIFAMVDDLGWNGFGFNGNNDEVQSPTINDLARNGVILHAHYVYKFCSPTRASFLTGRIPGHGVQEVNLGFTQPIGCNLNLTMIGAKMKSANYTTAQVGKWHQGYFKQEYTPHGRGFDTSFGFLGGGEDHLSQCHACENSIPAPDWATQKFSCPAKYSPCGVKCPDQGGIDMYCTDKPCVGQNTTANPYLYASEMTRLIRTAARSTKPLFVFLALHNVHQPVESPQEFVDIYPASNYNSSNIARRIYNGMHSGVEYVVKNTTMELNNTGLWSNTIIVFSTDNGGTFEHGPPVPGSSNFPLRGHKYSWFEGGIRAASFVSSPLLPMGVRGTINTDILHISDWYATFAVLGGIDPEDNCEGCVSIDGVNIWPSITKTSTHPPRTELLIGVGGAAFAGAYRNNTYKIIAKGAGGLVQDGWSAQYPGTTSVIAPPKVRCNPCLFDVVNDPRETNDLSTSMPELTAAMMSRYLELAKNLTAPWSVDPLVDVLDAQTCDTDVCWEIEPETQHQAKHWLGQSSESCLLSGLWYDGADVFQFTVTGEDVEMTVKQCGGCAFTSASGQVHGSDVDVTASGTGVYVEHKGVVVGGGNETCRITWTFTNTTTHHWADFCRGTSCPTNPHPPNPPPSPDGACAKMLETGYYQPYMT
eukprot:m.266368 g.266368  ORF g.266368 m.266368 type:complete len:678 (+) comp66964_c0_seq1:198-2231(+)